MDPFAEQRQCLLTIADARLVTSSAICSSDDIQCTQGLYMRFSFTTFRIAIGALLFLVIAPEFAHAATSSAVSVLSPNFHIIPDACNCASPASAPGWGCILATIQNLIDFLVGFTTVIITVFIALAGFTYMTSGGSAEKRSLANKRILNAVIGLLIVLCSWLIVDSIMKVIYNPDSFFGPWNSILGPTVGSDCLAPKSLPSSLPALNSAANGTGGSSVSGSPATQAASVPGTTGACNAAVVQQAAADGGVQMSSTEAAVLACFAGPESGCGSIDQNYNWNGAKSLPPSTAWGPFQITLKGNSACFNNAACYQAAGVSGPLNCANAFDVHGNAIPGALLTECQTAAASLTCSAVVADCNIKANHGSYSAWTGNKDSTAAHQACVANAGG